MTAQSRVPSQADSSTTITCFDNMLHTLCPGNFDVVSSFANCQHSICCNEPFHMLCMVPATFKPSCTLPVVVRLSTTPPSQTRLTHAHAGGNNGASTRSPHKGLVYKRKHQSFAAALTHCATGLTAFLLFTVCMKFGCDHITVNKYIDELMAQVLALTAARCESNEAAATAV